MPLGNFGVPQQKMSCPWRPHEMKISFILDISGFFYSDIINMFSLCSCWNIICHRRASEEVNEISSFFSLQVPFFPSLDLIIPCLWFCFFFLQTVLSFSLLSNHFWIPTLSIFSYFILFTITNASFAAFNAKWIMRRFF